MPAGSRRSRTLRRVHTRTPGSRTVLRYTKRKPSKAQCGGCGVVLHGVPNVRANALRTLPKTKKRPQRPYGGVLCTRCSRSLIVGLHRAAEEKSREAMNGYQ